VSLNSKHIKVGVYLTPEIPQSFRGYSENILKYFPELSIKPVIFERIEDLPTDVDLLWDIRSGGGNPPLEFMLGHVPIVVTVHGFAPISLSGWEYFNTLNGAIMSRSYASQKMAKWRHFILPRQKPSG
jgi:hypothetical protein